MGDIAALKSEGMEPHEIAYYMVEVEGLELPEAVTRVVDHATRSGESVQAAELLRQTQALLGQAGAGEESAESPAAGAQERAVQSANDSTGGRKKPAANVEDEAEVLRRAFWALHEHKTRDRAIQQLLRKGVTGGLARRCVDRVLEQFKKAKRKKMLRHGGELLGAIIISAIVIFAWEETGRFYWYAALAGALAVPYATGLLIWTPFSSLRRYDKPSDLLPDLEQAERETS